MCIQFQNIVSVCIHHLFRSFCLKRIIFFLIFSLSFGCANSKHVESPVSIPSSKEVHSKDITNQNSKTQCPFPVLLGATYGKGISNFDKTMILFVTKQLLLDLCEGHLQHLLSFVEKETGLFVDAKGYWTVQEVEEDLRDPDGYFALYYFNQTKLNQKKGSSGNLTIRDVFVQAETVVLDFYIGSSEEVEIKFRFPKDPKLERYLINPNFIKIKNTWYLHRMF